MKITIEYLESKGWSKTEDGQGIFLMNKKIENRNPINDDDEDTGLELVLHRLFGAEQFAIACPDGGFINLKIESAEDLEKAEGLIDWFDPAF